jgi:MBG domain-containing protein
MCLATAATTQSVAGSYAITQGSLAASSNYALSYVGADLTVNSRPNTNIPLIVSIPAYQPPKVSSIDFVTASNAPDPLITLTGSAPNTAAATGSGTSKQTAAAAGASTLPKVRDPRSRGGQVDRTRS